MKLQFKGDVQGFEAGLALLAQDLGVTLAAGGVTVTAKRVAEPTVCVTVSGDTAEIVYAEQCQLNRAFGLLVEQLRAGNHDCRIEEQPAFTMNGPMFDMSQGNAAFNVKTLKNILRKLALMGLNMTMLYCEDNYEVPNRPYFGYMRPTYTQAEMKELDDYAYSLGIEIIPCIQALAHMPDALHWACFKDIRDYDACLLVGKPETYDFVRDLLVAASAPFRTKRIHIGMDEAFNLGHGQYLDVFGHRPATEIMREHLSRVMEIVSELGLEPMMWDDMFFRAANNGKYYDPDFQITEEFVKKAGVPEGMRCVYWDYYRLEQSAYENSIPKHQMLDKNMIFAGGCWSWRGYGLTWEKTLLTTRAALAACRNHGVKEVFMTTWGDNGTESLCTVNLIGCQLFAELGYHDHFDRERFAERFAFCTGGNFHDFEQLEMLDRNAFVMQQKPTDFYAYNTSKVMMWQDILTGLLDKNYEGANLDAHYTALTPVLERAVGRNGMFDSLFTFSALVASVLSIKSEAGLKITAAYKAGDRETLHRYATELLPTLSERVRALRLSHMENWMAIYKPFGWDIMDMRYGSLLARIDSAIRQLTAYLNGELERIEELEVERLYFEKPGPRGLNRYGMYVSPSRIDPRA